MPFQEFTGKLDPVPTGFAPFDGKLDEASPPPKAVAAPMEQAQIGNPMGDDVSAIADAGQGGDTILDHPSTTPQPFDFRQASAVKNAQEKIASDMKAERLARQGAQEATATTPDNFTPMSTDTSMGGRIVSGARAAGYDAMRTGANMLRTGAELAGADDFADRAGNYADYMSGKAQAATGLNADSTVTKAVAGAGQLAQLALGQPGLASMTAGAFANGYGEARDAGMTVGEALTRGSAMATISALSLKFQAPAIEKSLGAALGKVAPADFGKVMAEGLVRNVGGMEAQTVVSDLYDKLAPGGLKPNMTMSDMLDHIVDTFKTAALTTAALPGAPMAARGVARTVGHGMDIGTHGANEANFARAMREDVAATDFQLTGPGGLQDFAARSLSPDFANPKSIIPGTESRAEAPAPAETPRQEAERSSSASTPPVDPSKILEAADPVAAALDSLPDVKVPGVEEAKVDAGITPRNLPTEETLAGRPISRFGADELENLRAKLDADDPTHAKITAELERRNGQEQAVPSEAAPAPRAPDVRDLEAQPVGVGDPVADNAQRVAESNRLFADNLERRAGQGLSNDGHPLADLTPAAPETVRALEPVVKAVADVFGTGEISVAHSLTLPDGVNWRGRTVINVDGLTKPAAFVVTHESIHTIQSMAAEGERLGANATPEQREAARIWAPMERALWDMIPKKARDAYASKVMKLTPEQAADPANQARVKNEMLADFGAKRLTNRADLEELAKREPALFGEFANRMIDWLSKVIDTLKGKRSLGPHDIDKHIADLNSAKMLWRDALVSWRKRGGAEAPAVAPEPAKVAEPAYSPRTPEEQSRAESALKELSDNADLFQYPKGKGTSLEDVAKSIDPRVKVKHISTDSRFDRYRLDLPPRIEVDEATGKKMMVPGGTVGLRVRRNAKDALHPEGYYGYSTKDADPGTGFAEPPGENPHEAEHRPELILDASLLNKGDNGSLAYTIAADFAKNNGYRFIGDPSGLSDMALVRRTELMLSSALKHGTTEHIAPHPRQVVGEEKLGVAPLKWVYGDHVGNIERMIDVARQTADNQHPVKFDFDPKTGEFNEGGFSFDREGLGAVARSFGGRDGAGNRTLARAALWRALLRGEGGEVQGGGGDGQSVLEKLVHVGREHGSNRQALNEAFYSPRTEEAPAEDRGYGLGPKALLGKVREAPTVVMDMVDAALDKAGIYKGVAPMSSGSKEARAVAQKFINEQRAANHQWAAMTTDLMKRFTKPEREAMWNAADEQNTLLSRGEDTAGKGLDRLTPEQRAVVEQMHAYGERLWQMAQDAGMVKGEGVKYWTPRMMAIVDEATGNATEARTRGKKTTTSGEGRNITTSASSIKQRKYETAAETEAAMKAKGGTLVRDIATMPLAMKRLENAIAGRQLINTIKEIGLVKGQDLVSNGAGPGFFTLDHPAFQTWRPELRKNAEGKWETVMKDDGTPVMQAQPLFISKDFEGPLKAVMSGAPHALDPLYRAYMLLKSKAMSAIMYSPLIHDMVILGRAFAYAHVKAPLWMFVTGRMARADRDLMNLAIRHGMVPISGANHTMLDVGDIANGIGKEGGWGDPNESWVGLGAKALGNKVSDGLGDKLKAGIDKAGDFWHGTLLWNRVGDLQAAIFKDAFTNLQAKGYSDGVAATLAAHYANRYAGAVGREQMSEVARQVLNVMLFSRSFNVGNIGAVKDVFFGLPAGLRAQVEALAKNDKDKGAIGAAKRKAFSGLVMDFAAALIATSVYQDWKKRDKDKAFSEQLAEAGQGYAQRAAEMVEGIKKHPDRLKSYSPYNLSSTRDNEPGKQDRIDLGAQPNMARHEYQRLPTGKVVEDTIGWTTDLPDTFLKKMSPMTKSLVGWINNNSRVGAGYEKPIWDADGTLTQKAMDVAKYLVSAELPAEQFELLRDLYAGRATQLDKDKLLGNFTGLSVSQGHPMGPEGKVAQDVEEKLKTKKAYVIDDVKRDVKAGDIDKAIERLVDAGFTQREAVKAVGRIESPATGVSKTVMKKFYQHANDDELETMERVSK